MFLDLLFFTQTSSGRFSVIVLALNNVATATKIKKCFILYSLKNMKPMQFTITWAPKKDLFPINSGSTQA